MSETRAQEIERRVLEGDVLIIHRLADRFEQDVLHQALDQEGIVHEMRLSYEHTYSFLFRPQQGHGVVLVRATDAERASALIAQVLGQDAAAAENARLDAEASVADEEAPTE